MSKADLLDAFVKELTSTKNFAGRAAVLRSGQLHNVFQKRRPTGIFDLDVYLRGGYPAGSIVHIWGRESSGKTTLANLAIAENQKIYGDDSTVLIACTETTYDKEYARKCGVRVAFAEDELQQLEEKKGTKFTKTEREELMSETGRVYLMLGESSEVVLNGILTFIKSGMLDLVVIDSIAAMETSAAMDADIGDWAYAGGSRARLIGDFLRKVCACMNMSAVTDKPIETTVLILNQVTANIGVYGSDIKAPGGHALRHLKAIDLYLKSTASDRLKIGNLIYGRTIHWKLEKGKLGCPDGASGKVDIYLEPFQNKKPVWVNNAKCALETAVGLGLVERLGSWYRLDGAPLGQGIENAAATLEAHPELVKRLKKEAIQQLFHEGNQAKGTKVGKKESKRTRQRSKSNTS